MKKRMMVWTFGLMLITMALQISLMRVASSSEKFQEVLISNQLLYPGDPLTTESFSTVRIGESSLEPWMIRASELKLPAWSSRTLRQGEFLTQDSLSLKPDYDYAEIALKLEPQDAAAYKIVIGEEIDLLGIKGDEALIHFKTMNVSDILDQNLQSCEISMLQPVYLILTGEKKEILELCRIKATHTFQVIRKKPPGQREG